MAPAGLELLLPPVPPAGAEAISGQALVGPLRGPSRVSSYIPNVQPVRESGRCLSRFWMIPWYSPDLLGL